MNKQPSPNLYELNLSETLADLRGRVPVTMSPETFLRRFQITRDALPREVTVLEPLAPSDYPQSAMLEVFVSPDGDDSAEGTKDAPLRTPAAALQRVAEKGGATITLRGGTYSLSESVAVGREHSGRAGAPLILRSAEGERAVLTANTPISSEKSLWRVADPATDPVAARLPKAAQGRVLCTTLAEQGLTDEDIPPIRPKREGAPCLYVGGEEYTLARYPNKSATIQELLYFTHAYDSGTVTARDGSDLYWTWIERADRDFGGDHLRNVGWQVRLLNGKDNFDNATYPFPDPTAEERAQFLLSWVNTGNIWYYGPTFEGWEFGYYNLANETEGRVWSHFADGDTEEKTPLLGAFVPDPEGPYTYRGERGYYSLKSMTFNDWGCKHSINSPVGCNTFYLFNAIEALDEPGEWFYDKETGILYIYPRDEAAFFGSAVGCSNRKAFPPLCCKELENAIIDGIEVDGSGDMGIYLKDCRNVVLQHARVTNTKKENLGIYECSRTAVLYSDFSASYTEMIQFRDVKSNSSLTPTLNLVQNCFFHDAKPTRQFALALAGCRTVISHNYFRNTCMKAGYASECIVEYNRFEGGSADVVDGGMYYSSGPTARGNHIRYNLFHRFNETHNAVYNDTMNSGNYAYYNIVSTLNSKSSRHKGWYSSTGMGNICFGNLMVFRDPWEVARAHSKAGDEGETLVVGRGDDIHQSPLFYYYFGKEHAAVSARRYDFVMEGREELYTMDYGPRGKRETAAQSLAGHWWEGRKEEELQFYLTDWDTAARERIDPAYINHLYGTAVILDALANSDYRVKYFYLPARPTGKSFTSSAAPAGTELLIPAYTYLDENYGEVEVESRTLVVPEDGKITLTYEELGSMERIRRAPAFCVIENNILLGGTPYMDAEKKIIGDVNEELMIDDDAVRDSYIDKESGETLRRLRPGYAPTSLEAHNFLRYDFSTVMEDARACNYTLKKEILAELAETLEPSEYEAVTSLDATRTGPTYGFDYEALGPVQRA